METIFDIATPEEILDILGKGWPKSISDDPYAFDRESFKRCPDSNYSTLATLYFSRGDEKRAYEYIEKIADPQYRLDSMLLMQDLASPFVGL